MDDKNLKINKILCMLPYLAKNESLQIKDLCKIFNLKQEELIKDMDMLFYNCGTPPFLPDDYLDIEIEKDKISAYNAGNFIKATPSFTPIESIIIFSLLKKLLKTNKKSKNNINKTINSLGKKILKSLHDGGYLKTGKKISFPDSIANIIDDLFLLYRAMHNKNTVKIKYAAKESENLKEFNFNVYSIVQATALWYIGGFCYERNAIRTLRLDRIYAVELTKKEFLPDKNLSWESDLTYTATAGAKNVEIIFNQNVADYAEEEWSNWGKTKKQKNGNLQVNLKVDSNRWLFENLLPYGNDAKIIKPQEVATELKQYLDKTLGNYK